MYMKMCMCLVAPLLQSENELADPSNVGVFGAPYFCCRSDLVAGGGFLGRQCCPTSAAFACPPGDEAWLHDGVEQLTHALVDDVGDGVLENLLHCHCCFRVTETITRIHITLHHDLGGKHGSFLFSTPPPIFSKIIVKILK